MFERLMYWLTSNFQSGFNDTWATVNKLTQQEWLILLALTTAVGFLCMRGFGSRNSY